jgi:hypothetical protein
MTLGMFGLPEALFILALVVHDLRMTGRVHPATMWGGGLVLTGAVSRTWISQTDLWLSVARVIQTAYPAMEPTGADLSLARRGSSRTLGGQHEDTVYEEHGEVAAQLDMSARSPEAAHFDQAIIRYSPEVAAIARTGLRKLRAAFPGARQLVCDRRQSLPIGFAPADGGSAIFSLVLYPRWVRFFFLEGVVVDDPEGRLEGNGSQVRSIFARRATAGERTRHEAHTK